MSDEGNRYKDLIVAIQKEYPLYGHINNPMDYTFLIEVNDLGLETESSITDNLARVERFRVNRELKYRLEQPVSLGEYISSIDPVSEGKSGRIYMVENRVVEFVDPSQEPIANDDGTYTYHMRYV